MEIRDIQGEIARLAAAKRYSMDDLLAIMAILRSPQGCPWDREQTHASIRKCLIEECYEVCEAIDRDDPELLREELGDLLFQAVFHARIAEEEGQFTFADAVSDIAAKMVIRHPHVFGNVQVDGTDGVLANWDAIKMATKHQKTPGQTLDSVARTLPALMRAEKLAHKVRKFALEQDSPVLSALLSDKPAPDAPDFGHPAPAQPAPDAPDSTHPAPNKSAAPADSASSADRAQRLGERLFALAAECDAAGIDAEEALTAVCERVVAEGKRMDDRS